MAKKKPEPAAATRAPSPRVVAYLVANTRVILTGGDLEGTAVEEDGGTYTFTSCGVPYAVYRIDGAHQILRLRRPRPDPAFDKHLPLFRDHDGWLELRTAAARDPRPWLEAGVGFIAGRLIRESGGAGGLR